MGDGGHVVAHRSESGSVIAAASGAESGGAIA